MTSHSKLNIPDITEHLSRTEGLSDCVHEPLNSPRAGCRGGRLGTGGLGPSLMLYFSQSASWTRSWFPTGIQSPFQKTSTFARGLPILSIGQV